VSRVSYGFLVSPNTRLKVCDPAPNSGVLVFPITTAPACLSRATCGASKSGTYEANSGEPKVVRASTAESSSAAESSLPDQPG
jgi:hypothetical protein